MAGDEPFPALLAVDMVNVSFGYLAFLLLGWRALGVGHKRGFWKVVALTPVYWAMMSWAGWRAIWQLWRQPFRWEKTPHENMMTSLAGPPGGGSAMKQIAGAAALWPMRAAAMTPRR
jgi:NhaP-type Na+/H+ or K+/H+ antiporter